MADDPRVALDQLASAIDASHMHPHHLDALKNAFNIGDGGVSRLNHIKRRTEYAVRQSCDVTTIRNWEEKALDYLVGTIMNWGSYGNNYLGSSGMVVRAEVHDCKLSRLFHDAGPKHGLTWKESRTFDTSTPSLPMVTFHSHRYSNDIIGLNIIVDFTGVMPIRVLNWIAPDMASTYIPTHVSEMAGEAQADGSVRYVMLSNMGTFGRDVWGVSWDSPAT